MDKKEAVNNAYTITIGSPLIREGLTISTTVSEKYVPSAVDKMMALVGIINGRV